MARLLRLARCHLCHLRGVYMHESSPLALPPFFFYKVVELVGGGSVINVAYTVVLFNRPVVAVAIQQTTL